MATSSCSYHVLSCNQSSSGLEIPYITMKCILLFQMLAKLSCGFHKPNQQTVLPQCHVGELWESMEVGKVRNLGGKLGESLTEELGCFTMADLGRLSLHRLQGKFDDKTA